MYQYITILVVNFRKEHADIIEEIYGNTKGISVNRLAKNLKGKVSRVKLLKELKVLLTEGIVRIEGDVRHKQKKLLLLDSSIKRTIEEAERPLKNVFDQLPSTLSTYAEKIRRIRKETLRSYLRHRLLIRISRMLTDLEGEDKDVEGGFDLR